MLQLQVQVQVRGGLAGRRRGRGGLARAAGRRCPVKRRTCYLGARGTWTSPLSWQLQQSVLVGAHVQSTAVGDATVNKGKILSIVRVSICLAASGAPETPDFEAASCAG